MQGLGSQLCNHLVGRVIEHIEESINPRLEEYYRITSDLILQNGLYSMCRVCETPYEKSFNYLVRCKEEHFKSVCGSMVTCGRPWCKPLNCSYCKKELCMLRTYHCSIDRCKNVICLTCSNSTNNFEVCFDHKETHSKLVLMFGCGRDQCVYQSIVSKKIISETVFPCHKCNQKFSVFDLSVELTNIGCQYGFCGRAICAVCKNEERGSH